MKEKRPSGIRPSVERLAGGAAHQSEVFVFAPFRLDALNEQLWHGEERVVLRRKPFAILRYLLEHSGELITKEELLSRLWPEEYVGEGVLKTYLAEIRRALGDSRKTPAFIETAHGRGYRFVGPVQLASQDNERLAPAVPPRPRPKGGPFSEVPPFVGRASELECLERALEKALALERQVVFVTGEAGIGKTLLVRTFLRSVSERSDVERKAPLLAWGQCVDQYGAGEPYLPLFEALGRLCRGPDAAWVLDILREHAPTWLALMPSAALAAGVVSSQGAAAPARMLREMAEAVEALTTHSGLILWLDDLHWADPSTLDLIAYLAQRTDPARLLLLAAYRVPESTTSERLPILEQRLKLRDQSSEVALRHLQPGAAADYLAARFERHAFPDELGPLLHGRTSGNPLFMVRLVDFWLERRALGQAEERWLLQHPLDELAADIPESLARMIEQQVELLDDFERSVLEAASAAGPEFCSATLAAATGEEVTRIEALCARWSRRGQLLRLKGSAVWPDGTESQCSEFIHALYRHAVYAQLGGARRAELHRRIGARLAAGHAATLVDAAAELAMHFERGQDLERAIQYLRLAADHALSRSAHREASEHLGKALGLLPKLGTDTEPLELELSLALAAALTMIKGYAHPDVERLYLRARELCQRLGETPRLLIALAGIGGFFIVRGAYAQGVALCEQMLGVAGRFGITQAEVAARFGLGTLQLFHGDLELARDSFEYVILRHDPGFYRVDTLQYRQDPGIGARCFLAYVLGLLGFPDRALEQARECLSRARALERPFAVVFGLLALEFVHELRGEYELAHQRARELLALCQEHGFKLHEAVATLARGQALVGQGQLELGIQLLRAGWGGYRLTGAEAGATYYEARLMEAYLLEKNWCAAWETFEQIQAKVQRLDEHWWEAELYRLQGELLQQGPRPGADFEAAAGARNDAAERSFERSLEIARARHQKLLELRAATSLARLWSAQGKAELGQRLLAELYAEFSEGFDTLDLRNARALLPASASAV